MPSPTRFVRSLCALSLVVSLAAAGAPGAALGGQAADAASPARGTSTLGPGPDAKAPVTVAVPTATSVDDAATILRSGTTAIRSIDRAAAAPAITDVAPPAAWIDRPTPKVPQPKARSVSAAEPSSAGSARAGQSSFKGRNHVWIPALGIDRSVSFFSCTSKAYPGDRVYRWGCAGGNNIYLFGHAHSVFKPLHDAYVRGRLAKGMQVHYADDNGRVSTYAVSWWKVTTPDKGAWAYAAQSRPSLTLQTCVGSKSQYRLIVRLAKVG